ncbi:MAG: ABC-type transport auxiliary lipoprotein family protein [Xanthomonadales bacterium]|nr:ABC-type transport auxiliary lipoprotein family protein [Xanthomonadales bacterium]
MKMQLPAILLVIAGLAACASEPVVVHYYALVPPVSASDEVVQLTDKPALVIERVELAEYLQQSGMIIQSGDNQLLVSRSNLWAESLELALPKALVRELQRQSDGYSYYLKTVDWIPRTDYRLRLRIDSLQATDQGEVVAAGRYQLISEHGSNPQVFADFNFHRDLDSDGYEQAVKQMQALLAEIAEAILTSVDGLAGQDPPP